MTGTPSARPRTSSRSGPGTSAATHCDFGRPAGRSTVASEANSHLLRCALCTLGVHKAHRKQLGHFEDRRQALADADAHRGDAVFAAAAAQLADEGAGEAGAGAAERMAERDRAAV